jgi:oxygen-independent coproporphyrinogen-3 oxidase
MTGRQGSSVLGSHVDGWAPRADRLGCYIHLPFCAKRCGYCSFNTAPYEPGAMNRLLGALRSEIDGMSTASWNRSIELRSVFIGGGTPSLATPEELGAILDALRTGFALAAGAEITVECNPESTSLSRLSGYRQAGVSRISLGVQSLDDLILSSLGRLHSAEQACAAFAAARTAGFDNVSVDLIYGLPGLELDTWEATVREVLRWDPDHLSAYALTLDEGSLWGAAGVKGLPTEDTVVAQYHRLTQLAGDAGYEHYEISNYARPGRRSAHNQIYWWAEEYLGFGPGAAGFLGDVRYVNVKPVDRYCALLEDGQIPRSTHETLTARQRLAERLILGLRLREGVPKAWIEERVALERGRLPELFQRWQERELLVEERDRVRLTEAGFLLSDALFVELL